MLEGLPIMLALCFMLWHAYYAQNYAGIIDAGLPVTYLVTVGDKIRFCHADHLLRQPRTIVSTQLPAETDFDAIDVWPDIIETPSEELSGESEVGKPGVTNAPLPNYEETIRCSTREIRAPQRLIEES